MSTAWPTPTKRSRTLRGKKHDQRAAASRSPRRFSCANKAVSRQPSAVSEGKINMRDFHGLMVWQKAHTLTLNVYRLTKRFPDDERFGLISQLRRSAASVPANLAEGCGRGGEQEFARFVQIAMGSAAEVEYHLLLAKDLGYLADADFDTLKNTIEEVKRMLASLLRTVREQIRS
ncbi:MAG: four helix bundle protein [Pirellulales bacterium]